MSAPILSTSPVPGEPSLVDVTYGLPDLSQGIVRVTATMLDAKNRPVLQQLVDRSAATMLDLRAALRVD